MRRKKNLQRYEIQFREKVFYLCQSNTFILFLNSNKFFKLQVKQELLNFEGNVGNASRLEKEEDYAQNGVSSSSTQTSLAESSVEVGDVQLTNEDRFSALYHGTWPVEHSLWHSGPSSLGNHHSLHNGSQVCVYPFITIL